VLSPDVFEAYERTYDSSLEDWQQDRIPLRWTSIYAVEVPLTSLLTVTLAGEIREPEEGILVVRNVMPEPAVSAEDDGVFDQDWRIEAWTENEEGLVHLEAMWRHMDAGVVDTSNETIRSLVLDAIVTSDEESEVLCANGLP
jgi:hypothetical protein